jgi:hypothetical protein
LGLLHQHAGRAVALTAAAELARTVARRTSPSSGRVYRHRARAEMRPARMAWRPGPAERAQIVLIGNASGDIAARGGREALAQARVQLRLGACSGCRATRCPLTTAHAAPVTGGARRRPRGDLAARRPRLHRAPPANRSTTGRRWLATLPGRGRRRVGRRRPPRWRHSSMHCSGRPAPMRTRAFGAPLLPFRHGP